MLYMMNGVDLSCMMKPLIAYHGYYNHNTSERQTLHISRDFSINQKKKGGGGGGKREKTF